MHTQRLILLTLVILVIGVSCGSRPALEQMREKLEQYPEYTIVLKDMESKGFIFHDYFQKYLVTYPKNGAQSDAEKPDVKQQVTDWIKVDKATYKNYQPCLGMAILGKTKDGNVSNVCQPRGYQYVGDSRFGSWQQDNQGNRSWEWFGKYYLMAEVVDEVGDLFEKKRYRVKHKDWERYKKRSRKKAPYFGKKDKKGKPRFGTQGTVTKKTNTDFFKRQQVRMKAKKASFGTKVKSRMKRTKVSSVRSRSKSSGK